MPLSEDNHAFVDSIVMGFLFKIREVELFVTDYKDLQLYDHVYFAIAA